MLGWSESYLERISQILLKWFKIMCYVGAGSESDVQETLILNFKSPI